MNTFYINGIGCVSAQKTTDTDGFLTEISEQQSNIWPAVAPKYRDYIPPAASRRMGKGVKMGVVASAIALQDAQCDMPAAIVTGSGMGCVQKSEQFLEKIIDNDEEYLTPIAFIQSTHNTVGAQIALGLKCKAYNVTYVQSALSFESALLDALMLLAEEDAHNVLLGGVDELGKHTTKLHQLIGHVKAETIDAQKLLTSTSKGTAFSEGAQFFVLDRQKQASSYAEIVDLGIHNVLAADAVEEALLAFLHKNDYSIDQIDAVVLGNNGDADFDAIYHTLQKGILSNTQQLVYKHLSGEYNTVAAFAMWAAAKVLKTQTVPACMKANELNCSSYKTILLYNQYQGQNHSFVLLRAV